MSLCGSSHQARIIHGFHLLDISVISWNFGSLFISNMINNIRTGTSSLEAYGLQEFDQIQRRLYWLPRRIRFNLIQTQDLMSGNEDLECY